ncbi:Transthyretin-like family protein [Ancylostoma caninum]|uniref:Transthyretin-like family protein n=1 Tax=Ancylostoma caninum TaxID=29170 RepID=A0A368FD84_ANCCA|nr:Transthyretin-like family protein [Ancylostoma caninum]
MLIPTILCASLFSLCSAFREQSIAVKGRLLWRTEPASKICVKLWNEDSGENKQSSDGSRNRKLSRNRTFSWLDPDDLLDQGYSDSNGEFFLAGATKEFAAMEPILKIYHDCND